MTSTKETSLRGTIVQRTIRGKVRFYHQWRENGKTLSRYLKADEVLPLRERLDRAHVSASLPTDPKGCPPSGEKSTDFSNRVIRGRKLAELTASVRRFGEREALQRILTFLQGTTDDNLLVISGVPCSGKTTLMRQALNALPPETRVHTAYMSLVVGGTPRELFADLERLAADGITHVFIDGMDRVTSQSAALPALRDTFAVQGLKMVLASDRLAPRQFQTVPTTYLSFSDYQTITKTTDLRAYLQQGGPSISTIDPATQRILAAVNRQTVLRSLTDLANSHTIHPPQLANDLLRLTRRLASAVEPPPDQDSISRLVQDGILARTEDETFIALPAIRRQLSETALRIFLDDPVAAHLGAAERKIILDSALLKIDEQTLADLVLLEAQQARANASTDVFRIRFPSGGFDIVIADREELTCELRNVRLATERSDRQLEDLLDQRKLDTVEHRYGIIVSRELVYLGRNAWHHTGIAYRNASSILTSRNEKTARGPSD